MTEVEKEAHRQRVLEGGAEVASAQAQARGGDAVDVEKLQDPPREEHQAPAGMEFVPLPGVDSDDQTKKADLFSGQQPADVEDHDVRNVGPSNSGMAPKQRTRARAALKGSGVESKGASAKPASKGASAEQTSKIAAAAPGEDEEGFSEVLSKKQMKQRSKSNTESTAVVTERLLTLDELLANRRRASKQKREPQASQEVVQVALVRQEEPAKQTSATKEWLSLEELHAKARSGRKEKKAKAATRNIEVPLANQENPRSTLPSAPEIIAAATPATPAEAPADTPAAVRDKQEFLTLAQLYANRRRALEARRVARQPTTAQITERSKQEDRERVKALTAAKKSAVGSNKRAAKQGKVCCKVFLFL